MAAIYSRPPCPHMCSTTLSLLTAEFFCFLYFHPSIFYRLPRFRSQRHQSEQRSPDFHLFPFLWGNTELFQSQPRDVISPLQWVLGLPRALLLVRHALNTSTVSFWCGAAALLRVLLEWPSFLPYISLLLIRKSSATLQRNLSHRLKDKCLLSQP